MFQAPGGYEYGYRTFRPVHDEDGTIDVRVCTRCGALVDDDRRPLHDEWHAKNDKETT